jgi:uncharacterized protein YndB with AHSA1/START domain
MRCWSATFAGCWTVDQAPLPTVARTRVLGAGPGEVYGIVSDPHKLVLWWPRVERVENVSGEPGRERTRWTAVMAADSGRRLRLDYRCVGAARPKRYMWEHELEGTLVENHLESQTTEILIEPREGKTEMTMVSVNDRRGSARLAGFTMKRRQRELIDLAFEGLEDTIEQLGLEPEGAAS